MTEKELHDLKNILRRLEIMATLLNERDFRDFTEEEILSDARKDLESLQKLLKL